MSIDAIVIPLVAYFLGGLSPYYSVMKVIGDNPVDPADEKRLKRISSITDIAKGFVATFIGFKISVTTGFICAAAVVIGDFFPALYKFKGGRGLITAIGAGIAIAVAYLL